MSAAKAFPKIPNDDFTKPCSVVRPWVNNLSFKQQTVCLTALRGVDGARKDDESKKFCKAMRMTLLQNASPGVGTFMEFDISAEEVRRFWEATDHYPVHWLTHFMYAAQIIGAHHPNHEIRKWWDMFYNGLVNALHLRPEQFYDMEERLADTV